MNRRLVPLSQKLLYAQGIGSRFIIMVKQPQFILLELLSLPVPWVKHFLEDLFLDLLIDCLTYGKNSPWMVPFASKNVINMALSFDFVWLSLAFFDTKTSTDHSDTWLSGCIQISMSHQPWWLYEGSLVQFDDVWWCSDTPACGTSSDHHSAFLASFLHRFSAFPNLWWESFSFF